MGLRIVNLTNPESLSVVGICHTPGMSSTVEVSGQYAYVADRSSGLEVIDISDLSDPYIAANFSASGSCIDIKLIGNYLYMSCSVGFTILDISDPLVPQQVGQSSVSGFAITLDVAGQRAYVTTRFPMGLEVFDISNQQAPSRLGRLELGDQLDVSDISVQGDYAYLGTGGYGVKVVDVSDPANMYITSSINGGNIYSVTASGSYLYYGNDGKIMIADLSYPGTPYPIANLYLGSNVFDIKVVGENIYLATHYPFFMLRFDPTGIKDNPETPIVASLMQNFPNPFNASTSINYSLAKSGSVNLSIYNLLGQKVATLSDGIQPAGDHSIIWNAADFTSGVYFVKLQSGWETRNIKMVLLK